MAVLRRCVEALSYERLVLRQAAETLPLDDQETLQGGLRAASEAELGISEALSRREQSPSESAAPSPTGVPTTSVAPPVPPTVAAPVALAAHVRRAVAWFGGPRAAIAVLAG